MMSAHARATDPPTSHAAIPHDITQQGVRVLRSYRSGEALLDHTAYIRAGIMPKNGHGQRCSDLRQAGYIERVGRALTPSGKWGYLCRITQAGRDYLFRNDLFEE